MESFGETDLHAAMLPERRRSAVAEHNRLAVIDVGSNSVRLVVFDGVARCPAYFYNEKVMCGLGAGIHETGKLNRLGRDRALMALTRFAALARLMQVSAIKSVATAAVREAEDGGEFCATVKKATGLDLHVASGREEAALSAHGVLLGWPRADGIVCDMGGASMEFARVTSGVVGNCATSGLGPLQLANIGTDKKIEKEIAAELGKLRKAVPGDVRKLYLVGGSFRAIARVDMERRKYPLKVLHEYRLEPESLAETAAWIRKAAPGEVKNLADVSADRVALLPLAARVLVRLIETLRPGSISTSSYGIREGLLYELMPDTLRAKDPLLEAARQFEQSSARFPGFGARLFTWLRPVLGDRHPNDLRLMRAACHLHDIAWRAHPDYRAEVCFESVARANLGGIDHEGRVFLGLAIYHRYSNTGNSAFDPGLLGLLTPERIAEAELLGKAMRLGAMLSAATADLLDLTRLEQQGDELILTLTGNAILLGGEAVEKRLQALTQRMGCKGRVVMGR